MQITPVILCGGTGTRLWPLSREFHPKQFVDLGNGRTLFGDTLARLRHIDGLGDPVCVCNEKYRFYVAPHIARGRIILEPFARNTAPAIALAAIATAQSGNLLLALPADHAMEEPEIFARALQLAIPVAKKGRIVAFGIEPRRPATGFGYIKAGHPLENGACTISRFVEKPDLASAAAMLTEGGHYWNAGIFLFDPLIYLQELKTYAPAIHISCAEAMRKAELGDVLIRPDKESLENCPPDSIDYAVMEHTRLAAMMPLACAWNDLGSWESFYEIGSRDEAGNVCQGRVYAEDVAQSYIHSSGRLVAAIGVENIAIVETPDAVLVTARDQAQKVRRIVEGLRREGASEYRLHPVVNRPWGSYEILATGDRFQVKRIIVRPGEALSLQMHHHRAEHWIVVSGKAEVTAGEVTKLYTENQSTYIPVGQSHRLRNPGSLPLIIIEIQSGEYLGEDDIVRLDDPYGRKREE